MNTIADFMKMVQNRGITGVTFARIKRLIKKKKYFVGVCVGFGFEKLEEGKDFTKENFVCDEVWGHLKLHFEKYRCQKCEVLLENRRMKVCPDCARKSKPMRSKYTQLDMKKKRKKSNSTNNEWNCSLF